MSSINRLHKPIAMSAMILAAIAGFSGIASAQSGFDVSKIDRSEDPCANFFMFANGAWYKSTEIPADRSTWGSWAELSERNLKDLKTVLEKASTSNAAHGTLEQKVGDFYKAALDSAGIEAKGITPLGGELAKIAAISDTKGLIDEFAHLQGLGIKVPFALDVYQDAKNSTRNIVQLSQSGLGLPDRDYYVNDDADSKELRAQYQTHVANMLKLLGDSDADATKKSATIMAIETRLAHASMTQVQQRDPDSTYNITTVAKLKVDAAGFDWDRYFAQIKVTDPGDINCNQPLFNIEVAAMITAVPLADWKDYLRWHLIDQAAPYLGAAFVNEDFAFNGKILSGRKELRPRWKRAMGTTDNYLGEMVGKLFVENFFSPESKKHAEQMVLNLISALRDRLAAIDWISDTTRKRAFEKLNAIKYKIGYPDKWRDYSKLDIQSDSYVLNVLRASEFEFRRNLDKLGKPVDRGEWFITASTINAYYASSLNEIVFPAAILQPPFFDANADDALNYGGIGSVIGHELTHGFDDEGRKYDADGNLTDWWTPADAESFEKRANMIREQYDGYVAVDTLRVNGKLTSGENIADLGGLKIAYYAYQKSIEGKRPPDMDGFTPEQRFFLSFANIWRSKIRDEAAKMYLGIDPHSPDKWRVNGTISNLPEFAKAFGCTAGAGGIRSAALRVNIW